MIEIRHLKKQYENAIPIQDLSVIINDGDVISVIGPSGTGKSTLIRCMNRLEKPTSGQIIVDGVCVTDPNCNLSAVRRNMGMVFQSFNLFGHLTAVENVMLPQIDLLGADKQTAYDKAIALLKMVGLEDRAMQYPDMLSGGQKQRVAIARTLSTDPKVILFDEPTSALDPTMVAEVQSVIRQLSDMGKTMIIVTHEMKFAREICNRVFYLDEGGIYEEGTPEDIFDHPKKEKTRRFIRRLKVFESVFGKGGQDILSLFGEMEAYAQKNRIPYELADKLRASVEELGVQILLPKSQTIHLAIEYDEAKTAAYAKFRYGGKPFDPEKSGNSIALTLLKNNCSTIEHFYHDTDSLPNEVVLHIR